MTDNSGPWFRGPESLSGQGVSLRAETSEDRAFLLCLYCSARAEEMAPVPWPDEVKAAFLADQFALQDKHYTTYYQGIARHIVVMNGEPVGRLYVHLAKQDWRVVDVSLLPEARGKGIGGALLRTVAERAHAAGGYVSIHVEMFNPAKRLYERLGFLPVEEKPPYLLMHWAAA